MRNRVAVAAFFLASRMAVAKASPIVIDGDVPKDGNDFLYVPFDVPEGTVEVEVKHDDLSADDILDFGIDDPNGFRGWGGGNTESAIVGVDAASRSYLPGPMPAGQWNVVIGKAKLVTASPKYHVEITLRTQASLPTLARTPYVKAKPIESTARWYAGDFHVHSRESGDARPPLDEVANFAASRGLDFVELSDHNTVSQDELIVEAQAKTKVLLIPGIEYTTYAGHANAIGATTWVNHRVGDQGATIQQGIDAIHAQGALFSINHPGLDLGSQCIGCAWKHAIPDHALDALEIETIGYEPEGKLFHGLAMKLWEELLTKGEHVAAIGGSDDHQAGKEAGMGTHSQIGAPTTMVFARELSHDAIVEGIQKGRTVVKLQGPDDPMVEISADVALGGDKEDTASDTYVVLRAHVSGAAESVHFVKNGAALGDIPVVGTDFTTELVVDAPKSGEDRYRAEAYVDGRPRTITSHLFVRYAATGRVRPTSSAADTGGGCSTTTTGGPGIAALGALAALVLRLRRRAR